MINKPIPKTLLFFSFPILLSNLLQASILLINALWVGNLLGSDAFAAVTVGTSVMVVTLSFVLGFNTAVLTIFGQLKGADDTQATQRYLSSFVIMLVLLSVLIGGAGYFYAEHILAWLNTPESIKGAASQFIKINFVGTLFLVGYNFIGTVLRAFGDSKTPLYFVFLALLLTAALDPLFIAYFKLGVAGSAYATVLAQALVLVYSLFYLARRSGELRFRFYTPQWSEIKVILGQGVPSGVQMIVIYAGITVILSFVNTFGEQVVSGFGVAQRLDSLILLPAIALGMAVNTMSAQNIAAGKWDRVGEIAKVGLAYNLVVMCCLSLFLYLLAEPLVLLFVTEPESVRFGVSYLKTIAMFYPFIGLNFIFNSVVRGSGAMMQVLALNILSLWILRVPLAYGFSQYYGANGIALGIGASFMLSCLFSVAYYFYGGWREKQLI